MLLCFSCIALHFTLSRFYIFCLIPTPFTQLISHVYITVRGIFSYIPDDAVDRLGLLILLFRILILKVISVTVKRPHPGHQHRHANNTLKERTLDVQMARLKTNQVLMAILRNEA